jgi:hypothetical protein
MSQYLINTFDLKYSKRTVKNMKPFTTNLALQDSLSSRRKTEDENIDELPKEIQQKLKLIEKAFK